MIHIKNRRLLSVRSLIWLIAIVFSASSFVGCECLQKLLGGKDKAPTVINPRPNSANLQLASNVPDGVIRNKIVAVVKKLNGVIDPDSINIRRCNCDSTLLNITLPNSYTIEGHDERAAIKPPGGGQSGDIDLILSDKVGFNFPISTLSEPQDSISDPLNGYLKLSGSDPLKKITVGVFDTGLSPKNYLPILGWREIVTFCNKGVPSANITSLSGWNFVASSGGWYATTDDDSTKHGSRVAHLIARQFNASDATVKIIPMKVLDKNKQGDLFGLMCAMETARLNKVKIFNMSLGYYGTPDELLKSYVKKATDADIWIVTAAGNRLPNEAATVDRDLTTMPNKFYPASFSQDFDHVIAVTTARIEGNELKACERQNYAGSFVLGVMEEENCRFNLFKQEVQIFGTSYATPVLAGWLALKLAEGTKFSNRSDVAKAMEQQAPAGKELYQNRYIKSNGPVSPPPQ